MIERLISGFCTLISASLAFLLFMFFASLVLTTSSRVINTLAPYWLELLLGGYSAFAIAALLSGMVQPRLRTAAALIALLCTTDLLISIALRLA